MCQLLPVVLSSLRERNCVSAIQVAAGIVGSGFTGFVVLIVVRVFWFVVRRSNPEYAKQHKPGSGPFSTAKDFLALTVDGNSIRGWLTPSTNGAGILLVHTGSDRLELLPEAEALAEQGFGVMLFDLPGRGESSFVRRDHEAFCNGVRAAIDEMIREPTIAPSRVGALGFSCGAAYVAEVASRDSRLAAVVLAGGFSDIDAQTQQDFRRWGSLSQVPAIFLTRWLRRGGADALKPKHHLPTISPRPVLIIGNEDDRGVPKGSARALFEWANQPKELVVYPGECHGNYVRNWPDAFPQQINGFFRRALVEHQPD